MLPALKTVFLLFRGISLIDCILVVLASAAFLYYFRQRLADSLRWKGFASLISFSRKPPTADQVTAHCRTLQTSLNQVRRDSDIRVSQRLTALDRLIVKADREVLQLQSLLNENRQAAVAPDVGRNEPLSKTEIKKSISFGPGPDFIHETEHEVSGTARANWFPSVEQRQMIRDLGRAGHSAESIGKLLNRPTMAIAKILSDLSADDLADAA